MKGYTLIELVVFIVVISLSVSILLPFFFFSRYIRTNSDRLTAQQLAQVRMELILSRRQIDGYDSFTDPCNDTSPPSECTALSGYSVTSNVDNADVTWSAPNYKVITVTVSGNGAATLKSLVADYEP